jgi:hypothetical protein
MEQFPQISEKINLTFMNAGAGSGVIDRTDKNSKGRENSIRIYKKLSEGIGYTIDNYNKEVDKAPLSRH